MLCCPGTGARETGGMAEPGQELASGEAVMRMPATGQQPQMPYYPGMPMMHVRPGMPGMPPNFRGVMMPFVSLTTPVSIFTATIFISDK